jgi:hypothetical protein
MLSRADAVLIIIDIQGNLALAMHDKENLFANNVKLIQGFKENRDIGIAAIKSAEAHLTNTEMVLFELLRSAADPKFKDILKIVK